MKTNLRNENLITFNNWDFKICYSLDHIIKKASNVVNFRRRTGLPYIENIHNLADFFYDDTSRKWHNKHIHELYELSNEIEKNYYIKHIQKKNGGIREICTPNGKLHNIQKTILHGILENISVSDCATAYVKGKGIRYNVAPHTNRKYLIKLDFKDFFNSIKREDIIRYVFKDYQEQIAIMLATLCCNKNEDGYYLPQGACTSPYISNIVMKEYDKRIGNYCLEHDLGYTRYADDLTFSGDEINLKRLLKDIKNILKQEKYKPVINDEKTKIISNNHRQIVTGAVVNKVIQTPKKYRKEIRQEIYYIKKNGVRNHIINSKKNKYIVSCANSKDGLRVFKHSYLSHLLGKVSFCLTLDPLSFEMLTYRDYLKKEMQKNAVF